MYTYAAIAHAGIIAGNIIASLREPINTVSYENSDNLDFLKKLAAADHLEEDWKHGRYLKFIRRLRSIHDACASDEIKMAGKLHSILEESLDAIKEYEDTLFEYMSSRGDASFSECNGLQKWATLKTELRYTNNTFLGNFLDYIWENKYENINSILTAPDESNGLLTEMANAIKLADYLEEYETIGSSPEIEQLHATLKEIGAFDKWRNF